jgi:dihydrolipoamide dehydrogenase
MNSIYDLIVIGAGPGGYEAALYGAKLGLKTALVERESIGGVCLNWGCIPSKNLIHQAENFRSLSEMEAVGVKVDRSSLDYGLVYAQSRKVVETLTNGVEGLLNQAKVAVIKGTATITGSGEVSVDGKKTLMAKSILVATGSQPLKVPGFEFDEERILSSTGILSLTELPKRLVILGAGAIGCEFGFVMNSFGVDVTLVEAAKHILPTEDQEIGGLLMHSLTDQGLTVLDNTTAISLSKIGVGIAVDIRGPDGTRTINADKALVVFGRKPNTKGLGLQEMGVQLDSKGYVQVRDGQQTDSVGIYAIGDITATPALAHVASREGEIAIDHIIGRRAKETGVNVKLVPSAIYCEPQVAGFGLREQDIAACGFKVGKVSYPYIAAGKSTAIGRPEGLVKIFIDETSGEILGAHIIGHNATEMIHEILLASSTELLLADISNMVHAHPTLSEVIVGASKQEVNNR